MKHCAKIFEHSVGYSTRNIDAHATRDIEFYSTPSTSTVWTVWKGYAIRAYDTSFYFV